MRRAFDSSYKWRVKLLTADHAWDPKVKPGVLHFFEYTGRNVFVVNGQIGVGYNAYLMVVYRVGAR
jgi:hypothetical protein